jgi:acyl-CoA hydrolase
MLGRCPQSGIRERIPEKFAQGPKHGCQPSFALAEVLQGTMLDDTVIFHLIKPGDLNHHGTLFAGRMADWMVEACFIAAARLVGRPEDVICVRVHDLAFRRSLHAGDIAKLHACVGHLGNRSITVYADVSVSEGEDPQVTIITTFVTVDANGKPYEHGISLPADYLASHADACDKARRAVTGDSAR